MLKRIGSAGKAQQVGPQAGITRKLTGTVRVWDDPITYVYDTPGLMMPYLGEGDEAVEKGLKIALSCMSGVLAGAAGRYWITLSDRGFPHIFACSSAGLKENLYDPLDLADYLLYRLNLRYFNPLFPTGPELLRKSALRRSRRSRWWELTIFLPCPPSSAIPSAICGSPTDKRH